MMGQHHGHQEEPKPAPGALRLVQEFVNTRDLEEGTDYLQDGRALARWLRQSGLVGGHVSVEDRNFERAIGLREALRGLLVGNNGGGTDPGTIEVLNGLARELPVRVRFDKAGEVGLQNRAQDVKGALGQILGLVLCAHSDGTWERLKACGNGGCRWAFYDASKNRVGTWCEMAVCGNRSKSRAHRVRQKAGREREASSPD